MKQTQHAHSNPIAHVIRTFYSQINMLGKMQKIGTSGYCRENVVIL